MIPPVSGDALTALVEQWNESANFEAESNLQYAQALSQCADELAALLQAAAPPAPTAEQPAALHGSEAGPQEARAPRTAEERLRELKALVEAFAAIDWMLEDGHIHQLAERYRRIDPKVWLELIAEVEALRAVQARALPEQRVALCPRCNRYFWDPHDSHAKEPL